MKITPANMKIGIQAMLDQLNDEHAIPFKLTAHDVDDFGGGQYAISFYASRLHSIILSSTRGGSVTEKIRDAVLDIFAPGRLITSSSTIQSDVVEPWHFQDSSDASGLQPHQLP
jgi:hypothetical protein